VVLPPKTKSVFGWIGWIFTLIGAIDLPDQIQRWAKFIASLFDVAMNWDAELFGNEARWAFTGIGVLLLLIAYDVPQKLWSKLARKKQHRQPVSLPPFPVEGYIVMREAARKLAEESRDLQKEWALQLKARDMKTSDPAVLHAAMLDFVALLIAREKPLFGILIETGQFEKIPETVVTKSIFSDGARTFKHVIYNATPDYKGYRDPEW
jgi:hypothetical protein